MIIYNGTILEEEISETDIYRLNPLLEALTITIKKVYVPPNFIKKVKEIKKEFVKEINEKIRESNKNKKLEVLFDNKE